MFVGDVRDQILGVFFGGGSLWVHSGYRTMIIKMRNVLFYIIYNTLDSLSWISNPTPTGASTGYSSSWLPPSTQSPPRPSRGSPLSSAKFTTLARYSPMLRVWSTPSATSSCCCLLTTLLTRKDWNWALFSVRLFWRRWGLHDSGTFNQVADQCQYGLYVPGNLPVLFGVLLHDKRGQLLCECVVPSPSDLSG